MIADEQQARRPTAAAPTTEPIGPTPYGSPARGGRDRTDPRHDAAPDERRAPRPARTTRRLGVRAARRGVADLELERLEPAERAAGEPRDDVDPVALVHELRRCRPPEGDPVEDVAIAPQRQRRVVRAGRRGPG